jgi:hypothetical protein
LTKRFSPGVCRPLLAHRYSKVDRSPFYLANDRDERRPLRASVSCSEELLPTTNVNTERVTVRSIGSLDAIMALETADLLATLSACDNS